MHSVIETEASFPLSIPLHAMEEKIKQFGLKRTQHNSYQRTFMYAYPPNLNPGSIMRIRTHDEVVEMTAKGPLTIIQDNIKQRYKKSIKVESLRKAQIFLELAGFTYDHFRERLITKYEGDHMHISINQNPFGTIVDIEARPDRIIKALYALDIAPAKLLTEVAESEWNTFCTAHNLAIAKDVTFHHAGTIPKGAEYKIFQGDPQDLVVRVKDLLD